MKMTPDEEVLDLFLGSPEMEAYNAFIDDGRQAIERGDEMIEMPAALLSLLLPELSSNPMHFAALRQVHDRICEERGHPQLKTGQGSPETGQEEGF